MLNMANKRILIIAPHADDAEIGCGGLICKHIEQSGLEGRDAVHVALLSASEIDFIGGEHVTGEQRAKEALRSAEVLGYKLHGAKAKGNPLEPTPIEYTKDWLWKEARMDEYPLIDMVSYLDHLLYELRPDFMFIPYPSFHQDHQHVHRACIAALRPMPDRSFILGAFMYEYPYVHWHYGTVEGSPIYVKLTKEQFNKKVEAFKCHQSQLADEPKHMRSLDTLTKWAQFRGAEVHADYAEKFYLLRGVW